MEPIWKPQPVQTLALESECDEVLFGGAKGGGKSDVLLFGALRFIALPSYKALIVRRTFPRLKELIDRSMTFHALNGTYNRSEKQWKFPSGAQIVFGHCQNDGDELNYQGHQYHYIGFDQVEEFTENMFNIIAACGRKVDDIPVYIRCTANPGGVGKHWVKRRWIEGKEPNKIYATETSLNGKLILRKQVFIPSSIFDNKILLEKNPEYLAFLQKLPEKFRKMYLEGDFNTEDEPDQLITSELINNAKKHAKESAKLGDIYLGVDVARFGDDSTEIAFIMSNRLIKIETYKKLDINQISQIIIRKIREEKIKPFNIGIDTVGLGAGVYDIIKSNGFSVNEIVSGSSPITLRGDYYKFRNLRSQMHWHFREKLRTGIFSLGIEDSEFEEEALSVKYEISSEKMITIESKEDIKKRIGRSTNKHDAVVYACFVEIIQNNFRPHIY
ncbi:MAG: terminase family protein [Bacteroidota bacterium]|nr:terminase family protein [Bacteroidota bacterium]MDP4192823.1 terminase family protein [Bacteroidota bacterium]MDP4195419.1 terminase family protein [Bacteroidota bacterium]